MKGKKFLKVVGILMIIFGALGLVMDIVLIAGSAMLGAGTAALTGSEELGVAVGGILIVACIVGALGGILELITGILGVKNCAKPEKATVCLVFGIIVCVIELLSIIGIISAGSSSAVSIIALVIGGLAMPVLYIIGAVLNKKSA